VSATSTSAPTSSGATIEADAAGLVVLGIETSCDDTAAAVVADGRIVRSSVIASQIELHAPFGGVVPELAGRAHITNLTPTISEALRQADLAAANGARPAVDAVAATYGPGLVGSLLVGLSQAKALAMAWDVPFVGVNHLEAHLFASILEAPELHWPMVVLLVSGGHTMLIDVEAPGRYRLLGQTLDDAAGEAYDKVARYLGLGHPGGPAIDRLAREGNPQAFRFPRALMDRDYELSFSGLKTSVVRTVERTPEASSADVAASFQEAIVDVLAAKSRHAAAATGAKGLCLAGGVAANSLLRTRIAAVAEELGIAAYLPSLALCTDNAAMVAAAGSWRLRHDGPSPLSLGAVPNLGLSTID
jgi:N6-L-threonylcarbamoyladenine synthase